MITINATGDTTLHTKGKYCQEDILVKVPEGSGEAPVPTQEKTVNITQNGTVEVTPDKGYVLSKVTADISVPIPDGYIQPSGELEITENGTHDVTAFASVNVNVATGGGGGESDDLAKEIIGRTIVEISDGSVTDVGAHAFRGCKSLQKASFPNCESIGTYAFNDCSNLTEAVYPNCTEAELYAFMGASELVTIDFPKLKRVKGFLFRNCNAIQTIVLPSAEKIDESGLQDMNALERVDLPCATSLGANAFYSCEMLATLILRSPTVVTLGGTNSFTRTAITKGTGYIYVPAALVDSYKTATNWSTFAAQFRAIEDYPNICGV